MTAAAAVIPASSFAAALLPLDGFRSPAAHVAIETAGAVIAVMAAAVCSARAARRRALGDVLLLAALLLLAVVNLGFSLLPSIVGSGDQPFTTWAAVVGRMTAAVAFLVAAVIGDRRLRDPARARRTAVVAVLGYALATGLLAGVLAGVLPPVVRTTTDALQGNLVVDAVQFVTAVIFALAGWRFLRCRFVSDGAGALLLPVAMLLAAGARLNYVLAPTLFTSYVSVGDVLRLGFYLAILAGVLSDIVRYERHLSEAAVLEERQRLARDLHDGLAQELAYISAQAQRLAGGPMADGAHRIAQSAERALRESRYAISALMEPPGSSLRDMVAQAALDAGRGKARVEVDVGEAVDLAPQAREALRRIVAEAAGNAVRHGGASRVRVALRGDGDGVVVLISDDGRGFDVHGGIAPGSFGLLGMRERAEGLGGSFVLRSAAGEGTTVEVRLP
jgi:signal transduction histidine kinase